MLDEDQEHTMIVHSYCKIHLQEEICREALVKDWGHFINFFKLATLESGKIINFAAISREVGVSISTVKSHYHLIEEIFVAFRIQAFSGSPRKNVKDFDFNLPNLWNSPRARSLIDWIQSNPYTHTWGYAIFNKIVRTSHAVPILIGQTLIFRFPDRRSILGYK